MQRSIGRGRGGEKQVKVLRYVLAVEEGKGLQSILGYFGLDEFENLHVIL
jgi:hypothetical protein